MNKVLFTYPHIYVDTLICKYTYKIKHKQVFTKITFEYTNKIINI